MTQQESVKRTRRASVARTATDTAGYRLAALPVAFLTSVVTSRFLLPTGRGAFILATLTITLVASVLRIGGAVTHLAQRLDSAETRGTVLRAVLISCGIGLVGALALVPVNEASVPHATPMVALVPFALPAMLLTDSMSGFMLATGRVSIANRVQFVSPALGLATMAILVVAFGLGLTGALIGWMFGQWAAAVAALFSCRSVLRQSSVASKAWTIWDRGSRQMMAFAIRFGIVGAISVINYRIDLILLRGFHGVHDVGIYSLAVSLAELGWVLSTSLATAVTPPVVNASTDLEAASLVATACRYAVMLSAVSAMVLALGSPLVPYVFGHLFQPSIGPLLVLLPGVIAFSPASTIAIFISLRKGRVRWTGMVALLSAGITALAGVAFIPSLASVGAGIASTVGYTASLVVAISVFARASGVPVIEFIPRWADFRTLPSAMFHLVLAR